MGKSRKMRRYRLRQMQGISVTKKNYYNMSNISGNSSKLLKRKKEKFRVSTKYKFLYILLVLFFIGCILNYYFIPHFTRGAS